MLGVPLSTCHTSYRYGVGAWAGSYFAPGMTSLRETGILPEAGRGFLNIVRCFIEHIGEAGAWRGDCDDEGVQYP